MDVSVCCLWHPLPLRFPHPYWTNEPLYSMLMVCTDNNMNEWTKMGKQIHGCIKNKDGTKRDILWMIDCLHLFSVLFFLGLTAYWFIYLCILAFLYITLTSLWLCVEKLAHLEFWPSLVFIVRATGNLNPSVQSLFLTHTNMMHFLI